MQVSLVDHNYVAAVWEQVAPLLEKSIHTAHGRYTMEDILREIVNLGGERIMRWRDDMLDTLENWARDNHCHGVEMTGRRGFEKVLSSHGWTPEYTVFEKMFEEKDNG